MTLCAFVHPPGAPTILTDVLVTTSSTKTAGQTSVTPIEKLSRKSISIKSKCAIFGFAGDVARIRDFADYLPQRLQSAPSDMRPMRWIGNEVNDFNEGIGQRLGGPRAISVLGFCCEPAPAPSVVNLLQGLQRKSVATANFNECFAIGSGADRFLTMLHRFDNQMNIENSAYENLLYLTGVLNADKFFCDGPRDPKWTTWGGYLEASTMWNYQTLLTQTAWAHIAYIISDDGRPKLADRQLLYRNADDGARLALVTGIPHGITLTDFPIVPLFADSQGPASEFDWSQFVPTFFTVTAFSASGKPTTHQVEISGCDSIRRNDSGQFELLQPRDWLAETGQIRQAVLQ